MTLQQAQLREPVINQRYAFKIKDWETPFGEVIPGATKIRTFMGMEERACGQQVEVFFAVRRDDGVRHLISLETIESVEDAI
ncbi:hypothetical protein H0A65_09710 [Alcaligenaceae bacterium]|nr:hypothetical protein [Alcaligenaceae bacterium]